MAKPFSIEMREMEGVTVFEVEGELDLSTAPSCAAASTRRSRRAGRACWSTSTKLEFCDSTGLRALFGTVREARVRRAPLRIVLPASPAASRVFELVGASEFLPLVDDTATGLAQLASVLPQMSILEPSS